MKFNIEEFNYQMSIRGYWFAQDFIDLKTCDSIKKNIVNEIGSSKNYNSEQAKLDQYHLHDLMCKYLNAAKLLEDENLNKLVSEILGEYWIMYASTTSSCPPHATNHGGRIHVDSPRWINNYATNIGVIWALDDFTKENGATRVLPGSHNSPKIPSKDYFDKFSVQLEVPKGSLIIFNARLFHRTGVNKTDNWRHALTMNACRPYMKQRLDWVRFIPPNISDKLNQTARRIIGFDTRLPVSLEEFFQPEESRLYKSGQE
jgi:ectoine hydroxylase-related dioxygenase (phytanoyl-CoA dioxygenase family)